MVAPEYPREAQVGQHFRQTEGTPYNFDLKLALLLQKRGMGISVSDPLKVGNRTVYSIFGDTNGKRTFNSLLELAHSRAVPELTAVRAVRRSVDTLKVDNCVFDPDPIKNRIYRDLLLALENAKKAERLEAEVVGVDRAIQRLAGNNDRKANSERTALVSKHVQLKFAIPLHRQRETDLLGNRGHLTDDEYIQLVEVSVDNGLEYLRSNPRLVPADR